MYFIANQNQEIVAEAHSFAPTEPPRWNVGDKVQFDVSPRLSNPGREICVVELAGGLWFVILERVSITIDPTGDRDTIIGYVQEIAAGDPLKVSEAIKKYVQEVNSRVQIDYKLIGDLETSGALPTGIGSVIRSLLAEGKQVIITNHPSGGLKEAIEKDDEIVLVEFGG